MTTRDTFAAAPLDTTTQNALGFRLAPPFDGWYREQSPVPNGFTGSHASNPWTGEVEMQLAASSNDPNAGLTVGWFWCGWWRRVYVSRPTLFGLRFHADALNVSPNGGRWIPRAFLTVRRGQDDPIEQRQILEAGRTGWLFAVAPVPGTYRLGVSFNVRAAYERHQRPAGMLRARFQEVGQQSFFGAIESARPAAVGELDAADDALRAEAAAIEALDPFADEEFDAAELTAAFGALATDGASEPVDLSAS